MTGLLFAAVVTVAAAVWIRRRLAGRAARRRLREGPGTAPERAIPVRSFDEIDRALAARRCACGAGLRLTGEGTRQEGARSLRVTRAVCDECEEAYVVYFDLSELRH